ncbi:hypothetical protein GCM10008927_10510 [Amylibacter ulvae]|uniref:Uncharacterized protein n=1 Tax=Paramylibacter ulvae TaxID=1651968 RepID=A0ABQ3CWN4_9RHOB|nr:hypothetical protein [Amylibacter ulvae]GHA47593.1 hypothetical protein GCM10008927_10510 [Amylibacter ulvae]
MLARIVILAACLPYLKASPLQTDIQPHFFLLFIGLMAFCTIKDGELPFAATTLIITLAMGIAGLILGAGVNTLALLTFPIATAFFARQNQTALTQTIKVALIFYVFGLAVEIVAPSILDLVVSNQRGSVARGMTSFTSEPSYLGLIGLAIVVVLLHLRQSFWWITLSCFLVLASESLTAIAPLAVILVLANLRANRIHYVVLTVIVLVILFNGIVQTDTRMGMLLADVSQDQSLIWNDQSFSNRIARGLAPIASAFQSGFWPHAFPQSGDINVNFDFLANGADTTIERLSSIATVLIYVFGFTSIPLVIGYICIARARLFLIIAVIYFGLTNISISTPYLYLLLSLPLMHRFSTESADNHS